MLYNTTSGHKAPGPTLAGRIVALINLHLNRLITGVSSVFGRTGDVVSANGDYTASQITNVPFGGISATDVQVALNELDYEKFSNSVNSSVLLGRTSVGVGPVEEITLGTNLSFSGTVLNAAGGGGVTSVSGTVNRITSTGGTTPVINIDAAYDALWQPIDADLTNIAGLGFTSTAFLKKTALNTWALDTSTYLTSAITSINADTTAAQIIAAGTGLSILDVGATHTLSLANTAVTPGAYSNANITVDAQGRITTAASGSSGATSISALLAAVGTNTINNLDFAQAWQWNTLSSNTALALSATSTLAASNTQKVFSISTSGANTITTQTTYGSYITNTHTGTTSTNIAGYFSASGATNNYGLVVAAGNVGLSTITPAYKLQVATGGLVANFGDGTAGSSAAVISVGTVGTAGSVNAFLGGYYSGGSTIYFGQNVYYSGSAWVSPATAASSILLQQAGGFYFLSAASPGGFGSYKMIITVAGKVEIGTSQTPTAWLHISQVGTASANTAAIKVANGTRNTVAVGGQLEYENNWYLTNNSLVRYGLGGSIKDFITDVQSPANTSENDIYTYTTIASTLAVNGDKIKAEYGLQLASTGGITKQIKVYFGGTVIFDSGALSISASTDFVLNVLVMRDSSTTVRCTVTANTTGAATNAFAKVTKITGLTLSNTNILKVTATVGTGASLGDCTGILGSIGIKGSA